MDQLSTSSNRFLLRNPLFGFCVYFFEEFDDFFASLCFLLIRKRCRTWANLIDNYSLILIMHHGVDSTSLGTICPFSARNPFRIEEEAVSVNVSEYSITLTVNLNERISFVTSLLQALDVLVRKQHLGFLAAFAAAIAVHDVNSTSTLY